MNLTGQVATASSTKPHTRAVPRYVALASFWWKRAWRTGVRPAAIIIAIWTALGIFLYLPDMLKGFQWPSLAAKVLDSWAWALLTPALLLIDRKLVSKDWSLFRVILLFLFLSLPFSLIHTYLSGLLLLPLPQIWWNPLTNGEFTIYYFIGGWMTYCAAVGIFQCFRYYDRYLTGQLELGRVEKNLLEWRLNALRLQLEPHFLFNTLNAISSEIGTDPELARNMIADLGALLRRSLDCKDKTEISLAQELVLLEHYLSIQRFRFGDRIEMKLDIEPAALSIMVPSMLLQPLVENAIRHGLEHRLSGGAIDVVARRAAGHLQIQVLDDGVGLPANWRMESAAGLGIRVTSERLAALYPAMGERAMTIRPRRGGGTEVTICVPLNDEWAADKWAART
ncbi:sensor histidine kinase [Sphingomonas sp.]|uniref:sensor histidine kinase n=1 Tax=Sphingomonas sp. TaxID=28214 RepID=UPI0025F9D650|nr:sensor histidine kinase [Sphingomonas sp.]